jgi:hypothetical protein
MSGLWSPVGVNPRRKPRRAPTPDPLPVHPQKQTNTVGLLAPTYMGQIWTHAVQQGIGGSPQAELFKHLVGAQQE